MFLCVVCVCVAAAPVVNVSDYSQAAGAGENGPALELNSDSKSLFMFPFSPSSSTLSSLPPTLDTISELDVLSDISEDEPDLHLEPDSEPLSWQAQDSSSCSAGSGEGLSAPSFSPAECVPGSEEPQAPSAPRSALPRLGLAMLSFCKGLRLPSLLDEDGCISLPLSSPSLLPSFLLIFAVFLSACQSVALSLLLALPLALSLCYLEPKALARFRSAEVTAETSSPEEMQCDPAA
ncbi:uncharacterized protein LOC107711614 [Sinocyclocheilus rhinocerous]|uniref:uncharacterized protein LOC107711614 n=1 Tax=Sinocyclocheilus rhinocerous TaxID=307959 RepID=UPI0007B97712|nr:PREDICTED: uncharacterized protein LOC107711614 [Sinocyclocheilus rhinocerous]